MTTPKRSYAFVDGSYDPKSKVYGFGGFLVDQFGRKHIVQGSGNDPILAKMRNIAGEVLGARAIIELALSLHMRKLTLFHDYEGIAAWPMERWKCKRPLTRDYTRFVRRAMHDGLHLYFEQVKGHTGIEGNEEADQLAKLAIKLVAK